MSARARQAARVWRLAATVPDAAAADLVAAALATVCGAVSAFAVAPDGAWRVEGLAARRPPRSLVEAALAVAWLGRADAPPPLVPERLPPRDWLAENQASFPPLAAGRYFIHGSHYHGRIPAGRIGLAIDAATAFGTGEHATTRGCLLALDAIARRRRARRVLDMGTGTGILAIAAAKTWRRRVQARDLDAEAIRVASRNAAANGVGALVETRRGDGYRGVGRGFDLVFANILARPLALMAPALARALAPGGLAVLSGLLAGQDRAVLAAHRAQRLRLVRRIRGAGWHTLVLARACASFPPLREDE